MRWLWVSLPYATFGIAVSPEGRVVTAAPIARWMVGGDVPYDWIERKDGAVASLWRLG